MAPVELVEADGALATAVFLSYEEIAEVLAWVVAEAGALAAGLVVSFLPVDEVAVDCLATADVDAAVAFPATYCDAIFEAVV